MFFVVDITLAKFAAGLRLLKSDGVAKLAAGLMFCPTYASEDPILVGSLQPGLCF